MAAFGAAAVACLASVPRTRRVSDAETRRGLVALLLTSGGWATAHVLFLVAPTATLKLAFYDLGLVIGFSSVGTWLYFCSAYTGRTLHRAPGVRRLAVGVFLAVVAVKLTNPLHGLYLQTQFVTEPFPHLAVENHLLHWVAMAMAYAFALVGYFMLFELFWQVGHDTTSLVALVGLTGLPGVLDLVGARSSQLLDITYEPLGVAAFAVGVLFLYIEDFQFVQATGRYDDPVVVVDDDHRVRDYNADAEGLFDNLATGDRFDPVIPEFAGRGDDEETVVEIDRAGGLRYYRLSTDPFRSDHSGVGEVLTFTDVTERERYRQKLERQNEQLEQFATMVSHDLRNPLAVAAGHLELAQDSRESDELETVAAALDRMDRLIEDLFMLAKQGQSIDEVESVALGGLCEQCWEMAQTPAATLVVAEDCTIMADPNRLKQLLENLFRNAVEHGGPEVTVRVGCIDSGEGFYVADDGPGISAAEREVVFDSGYSTTTDGTGFGLAIVTEVAAAHDWSISVQESRSGGTRFEITGIAPNPD